MEFPYSDHVPEKLTNHMPFPNASTHRAMNHRKMNPRTIGSAIRCVCLPFVIAIFGIAMIGQGVSAQSSTRLNASTRLDTRSQRIVATVKNTIGVAGKAYQSKDFAATQAALDKAVEQIGIALKTGSPVIYDALIPSMKRVVNARVMLELEGVPVAPFSIPERPTAEMMAEADMMTTPSKVTPSNPTGTPSTTNGVSFVSQVAPILASKCGNCHINGSRGGF